jgi:hypothetical protein
MSKLRTLPSSSEGGAYSTYSPPGRSSRRSFSTTGPESASRTHREVAAKSTSRPIYRCSSSPPRSTSIGVSRRSWQENVRPWRTSTVARNARRSEPDAGTGLAADSCGRSGSCATLLPAALDTSATSQFRVYRSGISCSKTPSAVSKIILPRLAPKEPLRDPFSYS